MQVRQRLKINAAISVAAAVAIILVFSLSGYRINKANDMARVSGDIVLNAFERVTLRNDYMQNNNERAKKQWFARHEAIGKILESASKTFQNPEDKKNVDELSENHEPILKIFSTIVETREKTTSNAEAVAISKEVEDRLVNQLNIKIYETVVHGRELLESSRKARAAAIRFAGVWTAFVLILLIGAMIINSRMLTQAITDRVKKLRDGALVIGRGDLDHRIDIKGDDELAELSGTFNAMTANLKTTYQELSKEVEERKRAEAALLASEEGLKRAQEIAHLGSWELDLANNRLSWTDEAYRIFGLDPQEFAATYEAFLERVHPDDRAAVDDAYSSSVREGRDSYEIEHRVVRKDTGEIRYVHEKCLHFRDKTGKIIRSVGMVHDITERKKAEDDVLRLSEDMAARNLELEAANKELETFSYSVSHDLRAPLRGIDGFSRALLDDYSDRIDAEGRDFLERIVSATHKMGQLIDDLLKLARVSRTEMRREKVDLRGMAHRIAGELKQENPERGVEFIIAEGLSAYGDERLLNIVIENLIGNAWKFTGNRSDAVIEFGTFDCGLRICDCGFDKNSEIRNRKSAIVNPPLHPSLEGTIYYVRDNGAGFDMTYASKLFAPFQRLHKTAEFAGTGIGLATVKRIVNRHGGHVWIEGGKDKGATVYFTLP